MSIVRLTPYCPDLDTEARRERETANMVVEGKSGWPQIFQQAYVSDQKKVTEISGTRDGNTFPLTIFGARSSYNRFEDDHDPRILSSPLNPTSAPTMSNGEQPKVGGGFGEIRAGIDVAKLDEYLQKHLKGFQSPMQVKQFKASLF